MRGKEARVKEKGWKTGGEENEGENTRKKREMRDMDYGREAVIREKGVYSVAKKGTSPRTKRISCLLSRP